MDNFQTLELSAELLKSLELMNFTAPTEVQAKTIPFALSGKDVLATAQTGTGKTAAYSIPLVEHLLKNPKDRALILAPTRELAMQVQTAIKQLLGKASKVKTVLLIGGDSITKQMDHLKKNPEVIVGTPGRINDHLEKGTLRLDKVSFFVLDEVDRMFDDGFSIQLKRIAGYLPKQRQTLMFSATITPAIIELTKAYLNDPVSVTVGSTTTPRDKIKQEVINTSEIKKYDILLDQLNLLSGTFIVFVKTKIGTEKLAKRLIGNGHQADAIHGDLRQRNREKIIKYFREGKYRILVATDVAARGLDIPHLQCVVNYDLPSCPEDYIHRIGRTGRAGAEGIAISLITDQDSIKWRNINRLMNPSHKDEGGSNRNTSRPNARRDSRRFSDKDQRNERSYRGRNPEQSLRSKNPYGDSQRDFGIFGNDSRNATAVPNRRFKKFDDSSAFIPQERNRNGQRFHDDSRKMRDAGLFRSNNNKPGAGMTSERGNRTNKPKDNARSLSFAPQAGYKKKTY